MEADVGGEEGEPEQARARPAQPARLELPRLLVQPLERRVNDSTEKTSTKTLNTVIVVSPFVAVNASFTTLAASPWRSNRSIRSVATESPLLCALEHDQKRDHGSEGLRAERQRAVDQVEPQERIDEPVADLDRSRQHRGPSVVHESDGADHDGPAGEPPSLRRGEAE